MPAAVICLAVFTSIAAFAQAPAERKAAQAVSPNASTTTGNATIILAAEINSAARMGAGLAVADSVLRVLPMKGNYNVGVSVVTRSKINGKTPPDAIVHDVVTEVYSIITGSGMLVVGGTLDSAERIPASSPIVLKITGPSLRGTHITGGKQYPVGPGDIVVIPPNTPHGFIDLKTDQIVYTLVRIDPEKVLQVKQ